LQITSRKQQARRFDRWRGVSSSACVVRALGLAGYRGAGLCHAFLVINNILITVTLNIKNVATCKVILQSHRMFGYARE